MFPVTTASREGTWADPEYMSAIRQIDMLNHTEVREMSLQVRHGVNLHRVREQLEESSGQSPTVGEWASALGMSSEALLGTLRRSRRAKDKLVSSNLRLVNMVVNRHINQARFLTHQDLMQEGSVALMRAAEKYDPDVGSLFSTYATWCITGAVRRAIQDKDSLVRVPISQQEKLIALTRVMRQLTEDDPLGEEPTAAEVAVASRMDEEEVQRLLQLLNSHRRSAVSLDAHPGLSSKGLVSDGDVTFNSVSLTSVQEDIQAVLKRHLGPQELTALQLRYYLDRTDTGVRSYSQRHIRSLREVGRLMDLSKERIRVILQGAVAKLQDTGIGDYFGTV